MVQNPKPPVKFLVHWVLLSSPNYKIHKSVRIFRFHGFIWSDHFWNFKSCWFNDRILDFSLWPRSEWMLSFLPFWQMICCPFWATTCAILLAPEGWLLKSVLQSFTSCLSAHYVGRIQSKVQCRWRMQTPQSSWPSVCSLQCCVLFRFSIIGGINAFTLC